MRIKSFLRSLHAPVYKKRIQVLSSLIASTLKPNDRILDVGCGFGALGKAVTQAPQCPKDVVVEGLERATRGNEMIRVHAYLGGVMPFADSSYDVVIIADVLHHEKNPETLLKCARVASRTVIVKDHKPDGLLGRSRISLMDWAANVGYDVPCLYRYPTHQEWQHQFAASNLKLDSEITSIAIYPPIWNFLFGNRLHYIAILSSNKQ